MKQYLTLFLAAALTLSAMAQRRYYEEPFLTKSFTGQSFQQVKSVTSGGNVNMSDLTCSVDASTSGGNIDINITELGKYVKLNNSGGSIHLSIPGGKGLDLKLYADKIKTGTLNNFSGDFDETHVTGTLNGGGIPVTVDGGGGRISLELR